MPTPDGKPVLEDLQELTAKDASNMLRYPDVISGAFADLVARVRNLEYDDLQLKHQLGVLQDTHKATDERLGSVEADRTAIKSRLDAVEKAPVDHDKKLDAMEKRVRTVEGAVGSAHYKAPKDDPHPKK